MCTNPSVVNHTRSCEVDFSWTSKSKEELSASHLIQGLKWSKFQLQKFIPNLVSKVNNEREKPHLEALLQNCGDSFYFRSAKECYLVHEAQRFVPCGKCSECLNQRSKMYALRCLMEAREHEEVCSLILTYDKQHLGDGRLHYDHVRAFFKRLRRYVEYRYGKTGLKFFVCGEYGDKKKRPHWHMMVFGFRPHKERERIVGYPGGTNNTEVRYKSLKLQELWEQGYVDVTDFDDTHAFYIARYVQKKFVKGSDLDSTLKQPIEDQEYCPQKFCSPGLGNEYFFKHMKTFLREGKIEVAGHTYAIPRCFKDLMKKLVSEDPEFQTDYYEGLRKKLDLSVILKFLRNLYDLARQRKVEIQQLLELYQRAVQNMLDSPLKPHTSDHDGELGEVCVNTS
ncbi:putative VP4 [Microviridae sp.]|nr:putative VP4 [Microviridae sp.]